MFTHQKSLKLIQLLRGIASILVVLFHITLIFHETFKQSFFFDVFKFGSSGVDIFFVLSGFIIAYANKNFVAQPTKLFTFLKRRFIRIFPIYWIIITVFLGIQFIFPVYYNSSLDFGVVNLLATYLLLPDHIMVNGVSWSLTNELFFYLLFAVTIILPTKKYAVYLLVAYFIFLLLFAVTRSDLEGGSSYIALVLFPMNMEFLLGVFIVVILDKIPPKWILPLLWIGILLFLAGAFIGMDINSGLTPAFNRVVLFGFPSFLVILALVRMELNTSIRVKNIFLYLGDASYTIYLIHLPLVTAFYKILAKLHINSPLMLICLNCLLFAAICFIGIIIYFKIEQPLIKKLSKALLK